MFNYQKSDQPFLTSSKPIASAMLVFILMVTFQPHTAIASESILSQAETAIAAQDYQKAKTLLTPLSKQQEFHIPAQFGLAKIAYLQQDFDQAEDYMENLLENSVNDPEYFYLAARIAGKQALSASIFTKIGYAKDTKSYFNKALEIDKNHQPSLIGLIGFHQQAPVIAGGDKDSIPTLIDRLESVDKRAAFSIRAPILFKNNKIDEVKRLYREALAAPSKVKTGDFKFDFAMLLSNQGFYSDALAELLSITLNDQETPPSYAKMRLYQIGKLAAESESDLAQGLEHMKQYLAIPLNERSISDEWVNFRLAQLSYLLDSSPQNMQQIETILASTKDDLLRKKINSFKQQRQTKG